MVLSVSSYSPSPAEKRDDPYIWVTWLTPLLAGSNHCQWAAWFQANHKFDKIESDMSAVLAKHDRLVKERAGQLESEGYTVYIEDQNKFTIIGKDGRTKVAGKADIVAIRGDEIVVEDCKTGRQKSDHVMQVLCYMLLLPLSGGSVHCRNKKLEGRLVYGNEIFDISSMMLDENFKQEFREVVRLVSSVNPARKVPSFHECKYCKISNAYCAERTDNQDDEGDEVQHDLF
ncbi:Dna2/Cas4 domain-containing protein [Cyanobacteria bacterium FACHB-DQ100]|nr:Dna2/Cas4 domain-containing protein [Cyanobacteria bacterium FACHB-DQ100]